MNTLLILYGWRPRIRLLEWPHYSTEYQRTDHTVTLIDCAMPEKRRESPCIEIGACPPHRELDWPHGERTRGRTVMIIIVGACALLRRVHSARRTIMPTRNSILLQCTCGRTGSQPSHGVGGGCLSSQVWRRKQDVSTWSMKFPPCWTVRQGMLRLDFSGRSCGVCRHSHCSRLLPFHLRIGRMTHHPRSQRILSIQPTIAGRSFCFTM